MLKLYFLDSHTAIAAIMVLSHNDLDFAVKLESSILETVPRIAALRHLRSWAKLPHQSPSRASMSLLVYLPDWLTVKDTYPILRILPPKRKLTLQITHEPSGFDIAATSKIVVRIASEESTTVIHSRPS